MLRNLPHSAPRRPQHKLLLRRLGRKSRARQAARAAPFIWCLLHEPMHADAHFRCASDLDILVIRPCKTLARPHMSVRST